MRPALPASSLVDPHLPGLRRCAHALTGSTEAGDVLVEACLATLVRDPRLLDAATTTHIALHRLFHAVWSRRVATAGEQPPAATPDGTTLRLHLLRLAPAARAALVLNALEGFCVDDIARILDRSAAEVEALLASAAGLGPGPLNVLILEDDIWVALDLLETVEDMGNCSVRVATTRRQALEIAEGFPPDLVVADVRLSDRSSGIAAVADLLKARQIPVVFVATPAERAHGTRRLGAAVVVAKPLSAVQVRSAVTLALAA